MNIGRWSYETRCMVVGATVGAPRRLSNSTRKHRRPQERKHEHGNSEDERDYTHPPLLELCRRVGEEKHCGEQNSIREVLTGNTPGIAGLLLAVGSFRRRVGRFAAPPHLVKVGHKRMGISIWIFKRF